jgi:hypothetical protein
MALKAHEIKHQQPQKPLARVRGGVIVVWRPQPPFDYWEYFFSYHRFYNHSQYETSILPTPDNHISTKLPA